MQHQTPRLSEVNTYFSQGIDSVNGWLIPQPFEVLWPLHGKTGDSLVVEIGVFEDKFFIGLRKLFGAYATNRAAAIDVFDMQKFNLDGAGVGKIDVVKSNLARHGIQDGSVEFAQVDSLALTQRDCIRLAEQIGQFHFFSVDGCHDAAHTVKDVEFTMSITQIWA